MQIVAKYKTIYGKPGEAVVRAAQELNVDCVVMGTRGLGTIRRTILGSVSDYVYTTHTVLSLYAGNNINEKKMNIG